MNVPHSPRHQWRRLLAVGAASAVIAFSAFGSVASAASIGGDAKPTIVLVHGAWANPDGWAQVSRRLHADGYKTAAPKLDLLSISGDAAIVRATLDSIPGKKILVGHSYGGVVISNASAGRTDVVALVYTAAFVPDEGDTVLGLTAGFNPPGALPYLVWTGSPYASLAYIAPDHFRAVFAADLSPEQAGIFNSGQQATNPELLLTPSGPVGWHTIPSWYAVSAGDALIDPALQRWMSNRMGATTIEFAGASHAGGFTVHAGAFTKLIEQAAKATR